MQNSIFDSLAALFLILAIIAVLVDYGPSGFLLVRRSHNQELIERFGKLLETILSGLGYLLLTIASHLAFWLFNVLFSGQIQQLPAVFRFGIALLYFVFCIVTIIGRRRWFSKIITPLARNGGK